MQCSWIPFAGQPCPLLQRVESDIDIVWSIAAIVSCRGPDEMRKGLKPKNELWRFHINAVDVEIVGTVHFGAVQLRASHEKMNQGIGIREAGFNHMLKQIAHAVRITKMHAGVR
jgi:hypothetical protein